MQHKCTKWLALLACALCAIGFSACDYLPNFDSSNSQPSISSSNENNSSSENTSSSTDSSSNEDASSSSSSATNENFTEGLLFNIRIESDGSYSAQIIGYDGTDTDVVIPSVLAGYPVKSIGKKTFSLCNSLTSVTIPDSVTSIGDSAFQYCRNLTRVTIPDSVTSIGKYAFSACSGLPSITIPDSVTSIGNSAFSGCSSLMSITIPDSVTSIDSSAFYSCSGLTNITIPDSVTSIGDCAFYACYKLVEVINKSSLNIKTGSDDYGYVGYYALSVHNGESKIVNKDACRFITENDTNYLIDYTGTDTDLILPKDYNGHTYEINRCAFYNCSSLTSITIPDSVTKIGAAAFAYCSGLTSITLGNSVTSIGDSAFAYCRGLTSITLGNSVTSIDNWAFDGCNSLTSITIGDSVTSIGNYAFYDCSSLTTVYYKGTKNDWKKISVGSNNPPLLNATRYYYSETQPTTSGKYWHYDDNGEIVVW